MKTVAISFAGLVGLAGVAVGTVGCGGNDAAPPPQAPVAQTPPPAATASADPLGPKPDVPVPPTFEPPSPTVFQLANGASVWLVERHSLPMVSIALAVPQGAAADPANKAGLAVQTANMMDEGAGKLGALDMSAAFDALGAGMRTGATHDSSYLTLTVLTKNLHPALALFGDVALHPRFEAAEWKRVHELWTNELQNRASDPDAVAEMVTDVALFGEAHAYGHPIDGTLTSAGKVSLADVKSFYAKAWRPEGAVFVVVGDVTRAQIEGELGSTFGSWKGTGKASAQPAIAAPTMTKAKVVVIDRPDAPQSIVVVARPGIDAKSADVALASRVNEALGGTFTSRLNQDLREERGWTYGAGSRVTVMRSGGSIVARAAVVTEKAGEAAAAMLQDMQKYAAEGPTDEEADKTRMLARRELVELFESDEGAAFRLERDAMLGLPPTFEGDASKTRDTAGKADMAALAKRDFDPTTGFLLVVGPKQTVVDQLKANGLTDVELRDADGHLIKDDAKPAAKPAASTKATPAKTSK